MHIQGVPESAACHYSDTKLLQVLLGAECNRRHQIQQDYAKIEELREGMSMLPRPAKAYNGQTHTATRRPVVIVLQV